MIKEHQKLELDRVVSYSLGLEYESAGGKVPEFMCYKYGLMPVRDGSISGHEYVTTPLIPGSFGIILKQSEILSKYCTVDRFCSLHLHMGGYPRNIEAVLALYELCRRIQGDIFSILPPFKRDSRFFASKREAKDHCQLLPDLNFSTDINKDIQSYDFQRLLTFLNEGIIPEINNDGIYIHARETDNKWNVKRRYYWVNFIPLLFSRKFTVEFRAHHGTFNKYKIINWVFLMNAILKYAESNIEKILLKKEKITLVDVINVYNDDDINASHISDILFAYIKERHNYFLSYLMKDDIYCDKEFKMDKDYKWAIIDKKAIDLKDTLPIYGENLDHQNQKQQEPATVYSIIAE